MTKRLFPFLLSLVVCLTTACQSDTIFDEFQSLPTEGWHCDSMLNYDIQITDTITPYDIQMVVRSTNDYPYQNLWLFVQHSYNNNPLYTDTIECYLANDRGQWLGSGVKVYELPLDYEQAYVFPSSGIYTLSIRQGMRSEILPGIQQMGVIIKQNGKK